MAKIRYIRPGAPFRTVAWISAAMILVLGGVLSASDPTALIPADAAAILALPHLDRSGEKLDTFIRKYDKDFSGLDLDEVQRGFNLPDGVVDTSKQVFIVLTRPVRDPNAFVLVFTPRDVATFAEKVSRRDNTVRRCAGPDGPYNLMMRQGTAIVGLKRKAVRLFRHLAPERSLAESLDRRQREMFDSSDAALHIPLARWRATYDPFLRLAAAGIKFGLAAQHDQDALGGVAEVADWFVHGVRAVVDQMETTTVALDFDGETFRLAHHHTFTPTESVADYLGQVKRIGQADWTTLPDQPFIFLGALDWQCPPESSVAMRTYRHFFGTDSVLPDIPSAKRRQLIDAARSCYGQTRGSNFMVTSARGKLVPLQIFGAYLMDDPEEGLRGLVFLQENSDELVSSLMGGPFIGKSYRRTRDGLDYYELQVDFQKMGSSMHRQATLALYGQTARVQKAVVGRHHVVYSMGPPSMGVHDMREVLDSGRHVGQNSLVRRMAARLPDHPNAIIIADVGRCLSFLPVMIKLQAVKSGRLESATKRVGADYSAPPGPLLGWACTMRTNSLTGHLVMDADDLIRTVKLIKKTRLRP